VNNGTRFMYIRGNGWEPIGCLAITIDRSKNSAQYGLSMRHPKDGYNDYNRRVKFDRGLAQKLAQIDMNAFKESKLAYIATDASMHDVTESVMKDIVVRGAAPSRAVKFAKWWLRPVTFTMEI
jgi:hypothetical protein